MKQGRKSKTVLVLGCLLACLVAVSLAPSALAQAPAESEYDLGPLPGAGGDQGDPQAAAGQSTGKATADSDDGGGGAPALLIGLIVVAAICTGLAIRRLRSGEGDDDPHGLGPPATGRQSA